MGEDLHQSRVSKRLAMCRAFSLDIIGESVFPSLSGWYVTAPLALRRGDGQAFFVPPLRCGVVS